LSRGYVHLISQEQLLFNTYEVEIVKRQVNICCVPRSLLYTQEANLSDTVDCLCW